MIHHRIALVLADDFTMWHFFQGLIRAMLRQGHTVYVLTPAGPYVAKLEGLGATHLELPMHRFVDPVGDIRCVMQLATLFWRYRIDVVGNMFIKPIIYGSFAARLAGVHTVVGMIEGLGYSFAEPKGFGDRVVKYLTRLLYRFGCSLSERIGFANPNDRQFFICEGYVQKHRAIGFRSMIGVNTRLNSPTSFTPGEIREFLVKVGLPSGRLIVTMVVARVVWSKGVREFVEAARHVGDPGERPLFLLVGPPDPGASDCVPDAYLKCNVPENFFWFEGFRTDIPEILAASAIIVLPSYYGEGVPRILLEALASGKPVITTDHVGCRETVDDGKNGFLVPVQDPTAFATAINLLVRDQALRERFGKASRQKAECEFSEDKVVHSVMTRLFQIDLHPPAE